MGLNRSQPIGIFDSGFGGLTVARALVDQLPNEDLIYLGDSARTPYGSRPIAQVREFALQGLDFLVDQGAKMLVIACNSASSAVLRDARERYKVPVTEVILPSAKRAAVITKNNRVGLICTKATAKSKSYLDVFAVARQIELTVQPCPRFVEFVEAGITSGPELFQVAQDYLAPLKEKQIDTLILGCTHYPLLGGIISYIMGSEVNLVSSADECAYSTYNKLFSQDLANKERRTANRLFLTTGDPIGFEGIGRRLMGGFVENVESVNLEEAGNV